MGDIRIINRRDADDEESCSPGGSSCGACSNGGPGCCGSRVVQPGVMDDEELLLSPGTIVTSKLTGEKLMVLKAEPDSPVSYVCRTAKYEMVRMFDFELDG